jgi:hypothetical protein
LYPEDVVLFPSKSEIAEFHRIHRELRAGTLDPVEAAERLVQLDPHSGFACRLLGNAHKKAGDLSGAVSYLWQAVGRAPCNYAVYVALSELLSDCDPDDALAPALRMLALWKLALSDEIPGEVAAVKGDNPETFRRLAIEMEGYGKPPEVKEALLPYLLLNSLQIQADDALTPELMRQIRDNSARCLPLWRSALREWVWDADAPSANALALILAWLGELGEASVLDDLLECGDLGNDLLFVHVHWAIWRIGRRFPEQTLAKFRAATASASLELRCALADQISMLPEMEASRPALTGLLEGFSDFAAEYDAPYLLKAVVNALDKLGYEDEADQALDRYTGMLGSSGLDDLEAYLDPKSRFVPKLVELEVPGQSIEDVCIQRILGVDDGSEEDAPPVPEAPRVKPDRNGPCWCGSGKKYKKCHLAADEEAARSTRRPEVGQPRPDPFYHSLLGKLLESVPQVRSRAEMREAYKLYFDSESGAGFGDRGMEKFTEWSIFDFRPGGTGRTVVEEYIRRRPRLPARELALLESWRASRFALLEIQRIEPGTGVEVKDVFAGDRFFVHDVSSSRSLAQWDCLLTRVQQFEDRWIFTGSGLAISRTTLPLLVARIEEECGASGARAAGYVRANSHRLHRVLNELHKEQIDGLQILNPEGDELEFSSAEYHVGDAESLVAALAANEVFEESTSKSEAPGLRTFAWLEVGTDGPRRSYGHIEIRDGRLRLDCNSRRRLAIGRQLLEKNAGAFLKHERDASTSMAEIKDRVFREDPSTPTARTGRIPSEVENQLLLRFKAEHYANWPDERLPALGGKTPREAVRSEVGKRAVEDIIRDIENGEDRLRQEGGPAFDFSPIRKLLGL